MTTSKSLFKGPNLVSDDERCAGRGLDVIERRPCRDLAKDQAVGRDLKGKLSPVVYVLGILGTFLSPWLGVAAYVAVAVTWLVPDRRLERFVHEHALED